MNIALLTIGDELCIGQIVNTNASWIADRCTQIGAFITCHSTIKDNPLDIIHELDRLRINNAMIIITGGLGPTHDDSTKATLCSYFHDTLIEHQDTLQYLQERYISRNVFFSERNREQAFVPSACTVLKNPRGTAPGLLFVQTDCSFIALPGVPAEMKGIMQEYVLPIIQDRFLEENTLKPFYRTLITKGIPESTLADLIGNPDEFLTIQESLAFLPSFQGVRLRLGVYHHNAETAIQRLDVLEQILINKAGTFIYAKDQENLLSKTIENLIKLNKTLSVVESCTGGKLSSLCTDLPGSSVFFKGGFITYSNELKEQLVHVRHETLLEFGAVSEQTAIEMAIGGREILHTDYCISITGIAGPGGGSEEKPVGLVWIGLSSNNRTFARKHIFGTDRDMNRERSVYAALSLLYDELHQI
jgi:nicotinamide-nucleotide amidase